MPCSQYQSLSHSMLPAHPDENHHVVEHLRRCVRWLEAAFERREAKPEHEMSPIDWHWRRMRALRGDLQRHLSSQSHSSLSEFSSQWCSLLNYMYSAHTHVTGSAENEASPVPFAESFKYKAAPGTSAKSFLNSLENELHLLTQQTHDENNSVVLLQGLLDVIMTSEPRKDGCDPAIELRDSFFARLTEDGSLIVFDLSGSVPNAFAYLDLRRSIVSMPSDHIKYMNRNNFPAIHIQSNQAPLGWDDCASFSYFLRAPSELQQAEWRQILQSLHEASIIRLHSFQDNASTLLQQSATAWQESTSRAEIVFRGSAKWAQDGSSKTCGGCHKKFTVFRRRHHCRLCGQLRCVRCSQYRKSDSNRQKYRVCETCIQRNFQPGSLEASMQMGQSVKVGRAHGTPPEGTLTPETRRRHIFENLTISERLHFYQVMILARTFTSTESLIDLVDGNSMHMFIGVLKFVKYLHQLLSNFLQSALLDWTSSTSVSSYFQYLKNSLSIAYVQIAQVVHSIADAIARHYESVPESLAGVANISYLFLNRLKEYEGFLEDLARATPLSHEDVHSLNQVIDWIHEANDQVSDAYERSQRIAETNQLKKAFCHTSLAYCNGRFLCEGKTSCRNGLFRSKKVWHLFDNKLVKSKQTKKGLQVEEVYDGSVVKIVCARRSGVTLQLKDIQKTIRIWPESQYAKSKSCMAKQGWKFYFL